MAPAPERIGFTLPLAEGLTPAEQLAMVRRAERLGYDSVWLGESWGREVFTTLAWIASQTSTIKLGVGIANVFSRTPALMAQTVATLDIVSGGRAILGLGTSGQIVVERWHGLPFQQGVRRLHEYTDIIRMILRGDRADYDGQVFTLSGFRLAITPQRPHVPIYFASITTAGRKATAEAADGWLPLWMTPEYLAQCVTEMRAASVAAGRAAGAVDVAIELHCGASDGGEARQLARRHLAYYIGGMGVYYHRLVRGQGFEAEADAIRAAFATDREKAASLVTDAMLDGLAVAGDPGWCRERVAAYRKAGAGLPIISFVNGLPPDQMYATLDALAPAAAGR